MTYVEKLELALAARDARSVPSTGTWVPKYPVKRGEPPTEYRAVCACSLCLGILNPPAEKLGSWELDMHINLNYREDYHVKSQCNRRARMGKIAR